MFRARVLEKIYRITLHFRYTFSEDLEVFVTKEKESDESVSQCILFLICYNK